MHVNKRLFATALLISLGFLIGCKPASQMNSQQTNKIAGNTVLEEEAKPTVSYKPLKGTDGSVYQTPPQKIKNHDTEILLGRVKLEQMHTEYDTNDRRLKISGTAHVLDEDSQEIGQSDFNLSGTHAPDDGTFNLKSDLKNKVNSLEKPVVRGKVTCLEINSKGLFDCTHSVVDLFIAYKKQIYSEQVELTQKNSTLAASDTTSVTQQNQTNNQSPTTDSETQTDLDHSKKVDPIKKNEQTDDIKKNKDDKNASIDSTSHSNEVELQSEGTEQSVDGRFEGQAATVDLKEIFSDDAAKSEDSSSTPKTSVESQKTEKKDVQLTKDLIQTKTGEIRPVNQAIGFPNEGRLRNATSVLTKQQALDQKAFFEVVSPERNRHFATYEMAEMITRLGSYINKIFNKKLFVGNISQKRGGYLPPHASHQIGVDADLAYPSAQDKVKFPSVVLMSTRQYNPTSYSIEKTYELLKYAFSQQDILVDRFFIDQTIKKALCDYATSKGEFKSKDKDLVENLFKNIQHVDGHGDHFHIRLKCSSADPACRQKLYLVNNGCS